MLIIFNQNGQVTTKEIQGLLAGLVERHELNSTSYGKILVTSSVDETRTFVIKCADGNEDKNYRHAVLFVGDPSRSVASHKKLQRICAAKGIEFIDAASFSKKKSN